MTAQDLGRRLDDLLEAAVERHDEAALAALPDAATGFLAAVHDELLAVGYPRPHEVPAYQAAWSHTVDGLGAVLEANQR